MTGPNSASVLGLARQHAAWLVLCTILLLATIVRVASANYSLWFDEYASLFFASQPFSRLWSGWMARETNPPLFYSILRGWTLLAAPTDRIWVRVPSMVAGVVTIAVIYYGVRRAYGVKAGLLAAALLACSASQIYWSQLVRGYSLLVLALTISYVGLLALSAPLSRDEAPPRHGWLLYGAGALVATYCHTTALLWPVIAMAGLLLVSPRFRPGGSGFAALLAANLVIVAGSAWWLWISWLQMRSANANLSWLPSLPLGLSLRTIAGASLLTRQPEGSVTLGNAWILALALFGAARTWRKPATRLTVACWAIAVLLYLFVSIRQPIILERSTMWMTLFPLTLCAAGIGSIKTPWRALATGASLLLLLVANLVHQTFVSRDWDIAVHQLAADGATVLIVSGEASAVSIDQACKLALSRPGCPFPVAILPNGNSDSWANGSAPRIARLPAGTATHLYLLQRGHRRALRDLQSQGILGGLGKNDDFLVGPLPPEATREIAGRMRMENGFLVPHPTGQ